MIAARMLILVVLALALVGCSNKPTTLNPVKGKVSYKGVPLRTGLIVFTPDSSRGETGKIAFSKIKDDGTYVIYTGEAAGVTAGWYRVTVASLSGNDATYDATPISLIPDKYRDPLLSQLQCEVKGNVENHLNFNLD